MVSPDLRMIAGGTDVWLAIVLERSEFGTSNTIMKVLYNTDLSWLTTEVQRRGAGPKRTAFIIAAKALPAPPEALVCPRGGGEPIPPVWQDGEWLDHVKCACGLSWSRSALLGSDGA